jgi:hypothetical protein
MGGDLTKQESSITSYFNDAFIDFVLCNFKGTLIEKKQVANAIKSLLGYAFIWENGLYLVNKGHPTGHYLTFVYNSFMVFVLHKSVFEKVCPCLNFSDHVAMNYAGDDSIGSVSNVVASRFNMQVMADLCLRDYGVKYTGPDKTADVPRFIDPSGPDFNYLSRDFCKVDGRVLGRLHLISIKNMFIYTRHVSGLTQEQIRQYRADSACYELSLYGEEYYNSFIARVSEALKANHTPLPNIRDWSYYWERIVAAWYPDDSTAVFQNSITELGVRYNLPETGPIPPPHLRVFPCRRSILAKISCAIVVHLGRVATII